MNDNDIYSTFLLYRVERIKILVLYRLMDPLSFEFQKTYCENRVVFENSRDENFKIRCTENNSAKFSDLEKKKRLIGKSIRFDPMWSGQCVTVQPEGDEFTKEWPTKSVNGPGRHSGDSSSVTVERRQLSNGKIIYI